MNFFIPIRYKLFILFNVIVLLVLIIKFFLSVAFVEKQTKSNFTATNETIHTFLSHNIKENIYKKNLNATSAMIESSQNKNIKNIYIIEDQLKVSTQHNVIPLEIENLQKFIQDNEDGLIFYEDISYYLTTFSILEIPISYMIISINTDKLNQTILKKRNELIVETILFFIFNMILVYFSSILITKPIENIVHKLKNTKEDEKLTFETINNDEFKFLANAIQNRHNILRNMNHKLSQEVEKKTAQLQALNEELENRVVEEVSKNHEKEKLMLHQSRLAQMGEMISMIAHQWRQPLSAISAASSNLLIKTALDKYNQEHFQEILKDIISYTQHLSVTIDDFREFFKSNKETKEIDSEELINSIISIISSTLKNHNITLNTDFQYKGPIATYPNEVKQVILNLIKNAEDIFLNKSFEKPIIDILLQEVNNSIHIEISDNAGGIPQDIILKIFDPYFTTKEESNGTGLGLYMSKIIIEKHCHGKLEAKNIDNGAAFTIVLPQF